MRDLFIHTTEDNAMDATALVTLMDGARFARDPDACEALGPVNAVSHAAGRELCLLLDEGEDGNLVALLEVRDAGGQVAVFRLDRIN